MLLERQKLNVDHTHFLLVDDGTRKQYGTERAFKVNLERYLCDPRKLTFIISLNMFYSLIFSSFQMSMITSELTQGGGALNLKRCSFGGKFMFLWILTHIHCKSLVISLIHRASLSFGLLLVISLVF